jgi:DNA helicase II / ATP-dependent DNA helicase PcrA
VPARPADPDALLDGLDDAQRRAVTSPGRPLVILAPAGSGKTRVLTRRIAHRVATGDADARRVLALTFTRKAAAELGARLRSLGLRGEVHAGTFHSVAWAQLRTRWHDQGRSEPTLLDRKGRLLTDLVPKAQGRDPRTAARDLATEIEWAKARVVNPDGYPDAAAAAGRRPALGAEVVAELYRAYEEAKRAARLVDFDDLLSLCLGALEADERFATAQRWRFRHLFVDELQDVNPLQFRLLEAWRGPGDDVTAVGDPQQAIYGWNGADAGFLLDIGRWWPSAEVVELEASYRSTPQVLDAASAVLRGARQPARPVTAARPDGPAVLVTRHPDDRAEAVAVARAVRMARSPGRPWSDQAVLVRTHAQTALLAEALREVGIPHRVRGAAALLDRPTVRRALRSLRDSPDPLGTALADLAASSGQGSDGGDPAGGAEVAVEPHDDALAWLLELGRDYLRLDPLGRADGFARWIIATVRREGADEPGDAVDVATFHAAKGLEWATVHLAGVEDGLVPIAHARTAPARAEEARLLYVAMTRAQHELRITWAAQRTFVGRVVDRRRSPLLEPLAGAPSTPVPDTPVPPAELVPAWREHLDAQRAVLAAAGVPAGSDDHGPLAELRRWRDDAARAARIDPASVLPDRVLERIAAALPADTDDLAAVEGVGPVLAARLGPAMLAALDPRREPA